PEKRRGAVTRAGGSAHAIARRRRPGPRARADRAHGGGTLPRLGAGDRTLPGGGEGRHHRRRSDAAHGPRPAAHGTLRYGAGHVEGARRAVDRAVTALPAAPVPRP